MDMESMNKILWEGGVRGGDVRYLFRCCGLPTAMFEQFGSRANLILQTLEHLSKRGLLSVLNQKSNQSLNMYMLDSALHSTTIEVTRESGKLLLIACNQ